MPPGIPAKSADADGFSLDRLDCSDLINGPVGEGSRFHEAYGYYSQGVDEHRAILTAGWRARLFRIETANTAGKIGLYLETHDLAVSKYIAGRDKDLEFTAELGRHAMTNMTTSIQGLALTTHPALTPQRRQIQDARIRRDFASLVETLTARGLSFARLS